MITNAKSRILQLILIAFLAFGLDLDPTSGPSQVGGAEAPKAPESSPSSSSDGVLLVHILESARARDLRLSFCTKSALSERIMRKVCIVQSTSGHHTEYPATEGATVKAILQKSGTRRLNPWRGEPEIVVVKADRIELGKPIEEFLNTSLEAGDIVLFGLIAN